MVDKVIRQLSARSPAERVTVASRHMQRLFFGPLRPWTVDVRVLQKCSRGWFEDQMVRHACLLYGENLDGLVELFAHRGDLSMVTKP